MSPTIQAASDSSWATGARAQSVSSVVFTINHTPIFWSSKKQSLIAPSTCEAACNAASSAACNIQWIKRLYEEIFEVPPTSVILAMDNKSAIRTAEVEGHTACNRHYIMRHEYLRQCMADQTIRTVYYPTDQIAANGFTKALPKIKHDDFGQLPCTSISRPTLRVSQPDLAHYTQRNLLYKLLLFCLK